ncbi:uncharacterized protein LOC107359481 [Tetranychus urticae]|uniref:Lipocalin/cytosolic fatty-acid binding domain-containing protein n=1 Tax=Tetranychus urticae TaxID=32264 RepID=T1K3P4_TETUR|nr:uncharacterized protein LOC107359481 [Tetranychus urticae]
MKSTLFVALIALAISSSFAVKIKGSCPDAEQLAGDDWAFSNIEGDWNVLGRSEQTVPRTVYNTIEIDHLYPGKIAVIEKGNARDNDVISFLDKYIEMTVGDFDGKSYYDTAVRDSLVIFDPFSFDITTSDGKRGQFWIPYWARQTYDEAVLASCVKIDDSAVDIKAWFVSKAKQASPSQEVKDLVKELTGNELIKVCQVPPCDISDKNEIFN